MDFCANCGTRLASIRKNEGMKVTLLLSCRRCGNEKRSARPITATPKIIEHSPQEHIVIIRKKEQKLRTLPTVRIEFTKCGNNLAYAWMVQVRNLEESSTPFFRCTRCYFTFRENS